MSRWAVSDGWRFGVWRRLLQLQLRWKRGPDRKQKDCGISWYIQGAKISQDQSNHIFTFHLETALCASGRLEQVEREEPSINPAFN